MFAVAVALRCGEGGRHFAVAVLECGDFGVFSKATEEGDAFGVSLRVSYTLMLSRNVNVNVGVSGWGGQTLYTSYACPWCGRINSSGRKWFVRPDDMLVSLTWVF